MITGVGASVHRGEMDGALRFSTWRSAPPASVGVDRSAASIGGVVPFGGDARERECPTDLFEGWPPAPRFESAACRGADVDPHWFFPARGDNRSVALARKVCAGCDDLFACREYSLTLPAAVSGIYGGWSYKERTLERRARRRPMILAPPSAGGDDGDIDDIDDIDQADIAIPTLDAPSAGDGVHVRPCAVCGDPLAANRQKTCGPDCAAEHKRHVKRSGRANGNAPTPAATGARPLVTAAWPEPLAALIGAGAELVEVRLTMDGAEWVLARR